MRVVHVAPTAFGADGIHGGGERYPLELARAMAAHADCTLLTFSGRGAGGGRRRTEDREPGGLRIEVLPAVSHRHSHPAHPVALGLARAVGPFDVVHAHQLWATPSRVAVLAARLRLRPARVAVTDHGLLGSRPRPAEHRLVHRFLTVSRYSADVLGVPAAKTTVVYGGFDTARFTPDGRRTNRAGVLFVGRLTPHKGVDRLIQALPPGAQLTVVGTAGHDAHPPESGYLAYLQRLAGAAATTSGSEVRFLGAVSDATLLDLYRSAAVLVLPSVEETCYGKRVRISELLGLTLLEAMACATPVVASRLGGLVEVVSHGETGFLVDPGDIAGLRHRLADLLGDPVLARRLGDNARQLAVDQFTWDACARRCLDAYQEIGQRAEE